MPIFHDPDRQHEASDNHPQLVATEQYNDLRRVSEESIRTEFCDGPIPDMEMEVGSLENELGGNDEVHVSDRTQLIESLKRGESPTWVPNEAVCGL